MRQVIENMYREAVTEAPELKGLYLRAEEQLTDKQRKSLRDHLTKQRPESAAAALARVPDARLFATLQGYRQAGDVGLRRVAASVMVKVDDNPVVANSFSQSFGGLFDFVTDALTDTMETQACAARLTAARSRIIAEAPADLYGVATNPREVQSLEAAGLERVSVHLVKSLPRDLVTEFSWGREHQWLMQEDAEVARRRERSARDAEKVREILDRIERTGKATAAEREELLRIGGKLSIGDMWAIEVQYDRRSIGKGEPSVALTELRKVLGRN